MSSKERTGPLICSLQSWTWQLITATIFSNKNWFLRPVCGIDIALPEQLGTKWWINDLALLNLNID